MVGITAYGAYLPRYRLERKTIVKAMAWVNPATLALAAGEKTVANADEDAITLAAAAARNALANRDTETVTGLFAASTTFPYAQPQNTAILREALDLPEHTETLDVTGSTRAATSALLAACSRAAATPSETSLVAAGEARRAKMGSTQELLAGDGGAAVVVGTEGVLAEWCGSFSSAANFPNRLRDAHQTLGRSWEERWVRDEGYLGLIPTAISSYLAREHLAPERFASILVPCPHPREHARLGKSLGFPPERLADPLTAKVGDSGAAHPLLMLCRALERAEPGDELLLAGFGSGVDVLHFRVTAAARAFRPHRSFDSLLDRKALLAPYEKYAAFRNLIPVETGIRGEFQAETPLSLLWRHRHAILGLQGSRCRRCGMPQFPPQRICANSDCQAVDQMDGYRFADRPARVFSYTGDNLSATLDPPQIYGIVDFDEGGRMLLDITDCQLDCLAVDLPVELHLRRKYHDHQRGVHTYFWKAVPIQDPER